MISDNWPCAYWNDETQQFLIVYVDDMKLVGPAHLMEETWAKLGRDIQLDPPRGNKDGVMTFLGCQHRLVEKEVKVGKSVVKTRGMVWDVSHSMKRCVAKYEEAVRAVTGLYPRIVEAETPVIPSETKFARCRAPNKDEAFFECPTCCDTFPESLMIEKFRHESGTLRPIRKLFQHITKAECTLPSDIEAKLWATVVENNCNC